MIQQRLWVVALCLATGAPALAQYYRQQKEVVVRHCVVASCDDRATEEGLRVLKEGGNAVDAAMTIAFLMAVYEPYNSSMYSLSPKSGHPQSIAPFKRTLRNSGPVIVVKDGKPYMILSAPGGRRIITAIVRTLTNVIDYGMGIEAAIDAPRIHSEGNLYEVLMEARIPENVRKELTRMGHEIVVRPLYSGGFALVQGILVDPVTGLKFGGSDPRTHGGARGY